MDGVPAILEVNDTLGDYQQMYLQFFARYEAFLVCISSENDELETEEILNQVETHCSLRPLPVIVVATKNDVADHRSRAASKRLARKFGHEWMSCSAQTGEGVDAVFDRALRMALFHFVHKTKTASGTDSRRCKCVLI